MAKKRSSVIQVTAWKRISGPWVSCSTRWCVGSFPLAMTWRKITSFRPSWRKSCFFRPSTMITLAKLAKLWSSVSWPKIQKGAHWRGWAEVKGDLFRSLHRGMKPPLPGKNIPSYWAKKPCEPCWGVDRWAVNHLAPNCQVFCLVSTLSVFFHASDSRAPNGASDCAGAFERYLKDGEKKKHSDLRKYIIYYGMLEHDQIWQGVLDFDPHQSEALAWRSLNSSSMIRSRRKKTYFVVS